MSQENAVNLFWRLLGWRRFQPYDTLTVWVRDQSATVAAEFVERIPPFPGDYCITLWFDFDLINCLCYVTLVDPTATVTTIMRGDK